MHNNLFMFAVIEINDSCCVLNLNLVLFSQSVAWYPLRNIFSMLTGSSMRSGFGTHILLVCVDGSLLYFNKLFQPNFYDSMLFKQLKQVCKVIA